MTTQTDSCAVCALIFACGDERRGTFGDEDPATRYAVCRECHESGRHDLWRAAAIEQLQESSVGIVTNGNLAKDIKELRCFLKHDSRIKDGVCPNGCALLARVDSHNVECPVCRFSLFQNDGVDRILITS